MDKEHIIRELQRTATNNGGVAPGRKRFENETGIRMHEWYGKFWTKWGDAVREAGLVPNRMYEAYPDDFLIQKLISLTRSLGRVPTHGDILMAVQSDATFPSSKVFLRLGQKAQRARRVIDYCAKHANHEDVGQLWQNVVVLKAITPEDTKDGNSVVGFVYLMRHGSRKEYKIGRTLNPLRREGQIALLLPEKLEPIHYIKTDDPVGVESYWHTRFADKRKEGEWFALTAEDVRAFKRWKRIF